VASPAPPGEITMPRSTWSCNIKYVIVFTPKRT